MEHEGRFFGAASALVDDLLRWDDRVSINLCLVGYAKPISHEWKNGRVTWYLVESEEDFMKFCGVQVTQATFDQSLDPKYVNYILSRVRGRRNK
jgi:hypothetical protein